METVSLPRQILPLKCPLNGRADNRIGKFGELALIAVMALLCVGTVNASPRSWQPLIVTGAQLPQLLGAHEDQFEVLAISGGRLAPIPFQVDDVLSDGRYALPEGIERVSDDHAGTFRRNDQLVMMLSDLGSRAGAGAPLPDAATEIEVTDPLGGSNRYAYIAVVKAPLKSPVHYVEYDPAHDRIETGYYRIGLTGGWPTDFALKHGMDQDPPDLIDRFKVRTSVRVFGFFTYHINENSIRSRLLAWKAGPVRVIRRESHSVGLLLGIHSPAVTSMVFFYRNYLENPTKVDFPWIPRLIFSGIRVRVNVDYVDLRDFTLSWPGMTSPPIVVGSDSPAEQALEHANPGPLADWIALRGDGRVMVQTLKPSADLALIDRRLYYRNNDTPDPPERYPGQHPGIGYVTTGWRNLSSGPHEIDSFFVIAPGQYNAALLVEELGNAPMVTVRAAR
ncbi:MAG: hypothetical protein ACREQN_13325 [Candidatus Binataceae bacterium]